MTIANFLKLRVFDVNFITLVVYLGENIEHHFKSKVIDFSSCTNHSYGGYKSNA